VAQWPYLFEKRLPILNWGWLGSRVVSVLDSGAEGPRFKLHSRRCGVTILGKVFTPIVPLIEYGLPLPFLYSIAEHRVSELVPVLGSQPAGDASHKPGSRLPLLSARPAVTITTLKRAAISFGAW